MQHRTWDDDDVLAHAEVVAVARTQSRAHAAQVAALPLAQARSFVRRLWEHAGSHELGATAPPELVVEAPLAADVAALLNRLGVATSRADVDGQVRLSVPRTDARVRFLREVAMARPGEDSYGAPRPLSASALWQRVRPAQAPARRASA